jgi:hypothetical protein
MNDNGSSSRDAVLHDFNDSHGESVHMRIRLRPDKLRDGTTLCNGIPNR